MWLFTIIAKYIYVSLASHDPWCIENFIYIATQIMESDDHVWQFKPLWYGDRKAELAVFTGSSTGVFCIKSYIQGAQSKSLEAQNNNNVNKIVTLNMDIFYGQENCALLGYYTASSVNFLQTFRVKILSYLRRSFWHLVVVPYRRFVTNYWSILKWFFTPNSPLNVGR